METERDNDGRRPLERIVSLRPCPFCGGKVKWGRAAPYAQIECRNCGCNTGLCHTRDQAHEYWNRRADDERVKMLIEAARDLLGAVDADSRVKRGDYYHARKSVRVALASFEQANA